MVLSNEPDIGASDPYSRFWIDTQVLDRMARLQMKKPHLDDEALKG
ncbi:MAG: hypothetical protein KatS3mg030_432 [Saprospiraceae bacterium]|nr:MAG: hypothetical protein KatS3mg030_432 [Saprospiraceae bacterium]